jgi:hypothetical protein
LFASKEEKRVQARTQSKQETRRVGHEFRMDHTLRYAAGRALYFTAILTHRGKIKRKVRPQEDELLDMIGPHANMALLKPGESPYLYFSSARLVDEDEPTPRLRFYFRDINGIPPQLDQPVIICVANARATYRRGGNGHELYYSINDTSAWALLTAEREVYAKYGTINLSTFDESIRRTFQIAEEKSLPIAPRASIKEIREELVICNP